MFDQEQRPEPRLARWFLISGLVGVLVALVLTGLISGELISVQLVVTLWPGWIVNMSDLGYQRTLIQKLFEVTITFGSEFILYGLSGLLIGFGINAVRNLFVRR
jgi:hypothetical protein